jgi:hypothetical protein
MLGLQLGLQDLHLPKAFGISASGNSRPDEVGLVNDMKDNTFKIFTASVAM